MIHSSVESAVALISINFNNFKRTFQTLDAKVLFLLTFVMQQVFIVMFKNVSEFKKKEQVETNEQNEN